MKKVQVKNDCCVYAIRCKENGRLYIGTSTNVEARYYNHMFELSRGMKSSSNKEWQMDYYQFGEDEFELYILENGVSQADRKEKENHWIDLYNTRDSRCGYNRRRAARREIPIKDGLPPISKEA